MKRLFLLLIGVLFMSPVLAEDIIEIDTAYPPTGYTYKYSYITKLSDTIDYFIFHEGNGLYSFKQYQGNIHIKDDDAKFQIIDNHRIRVYGLDVMEQDYMTDKVYKPKMLVACDIIRTDSMFTPTEEDSYKLIRPKSYFMLADRFQIYNAENKNEKERLEKAIQNNYFYLMKMGMALSFCVLKEGVYHPDDCYYLQCYIPLPFLQELLDQTSPEQPYAHKFKYAQQFNTKTKQLLIR